MLALDQTICNRTVLFLPPQLHRKEEEKTRGDCCLNSAIGFFMI